MRLRKQLFAVKSVDLLMAEMAGEHRLRRVLGPVSLTALGVGAIIGAGIFVLTGLAAKEYAGPALVLSFVPSHHDHAIGERIGIRLDAQHLVGFPR